MIATAVDPIARPIRTRRTKEFGNAWRTGEAGCSSSATKRQAEIMKRASSAASIRYSGQCRLRESSMVIVTFDAGGGGRFQPDGEEDVRWWDAGDRGSPYPQRPTS